MSFDLLPAALAASLDAYARRIGIPGLAIAAVCGERRIGHLYGVDAEGSERPVDASTWFSLASSAKHSTAAAVLDLASEGRLDLAAPIGRYLADAPPAWAGRRVESLLHHVSGLPEYLAYRPDEAVPTRRAEFFARYGALAPVYDEAGAWNYSNTNYILLGLLVAELRGTSFAEAVERIATRAGAHGVAVASPDWTRHANRTRLGPHAHDEDSRSRHVIGDGDLSLTLEGAAAWLEGLLRGQVVAEPWRSRMFEPIRLSTGRPAFYGCGWFTDRVGDVPICHHAGHYDGWTAMAYLAPTRDTGVLAMCNLAPGNTQAMRAVAQRVAEAISPGSTPLGLAPIADSEPRLTEVARTQLLRRDGALPDPDTLAEELRIVAPGPGSNRGVLNLWSGVVPARFTLVEERFAPGYRMRRYRLSYAERVEHVSVGTTPGDRLFWAWSL